MISLKLRALSVVILAFIANSLKASPITLTSFNYPGQSQTSLDGINGKDQIVGRQGEDLQYNLPGSGGGFFIADPQGAISAVWSFDYPTGYSPAFGIDNAGDVVGSYYPSGPTVDYIRASDGTFTSFSFPSGANTVAVNNDGDLAFSGGQNLFLPNGSGGYTTAAVPGAGPGANVYLTGFDDFGDAVGYFINPLTSTGSFFRDASGHYTTLDVPGSVYTEALGMNNLGQVVGWYVAGSNYGGGFMWSAATGFTTIDFPGAEYTLITGISDDDTLVGEYNLWEEGGIEHGLIGTEAVATPEPKSLVSAVIGFLLVIGISAGRRRTAL
jgi:hypothetical protein